MVADGRLGRKVKAPLKADAVGPSIAPGIFKN